MLDSITAKELVIICHEHAKLQVENKLLWEENEALAALNATYIEADSLRVLQVNDLRNKVEASVKEVQRLKSSQKNTIRIASVGGIVLFILGLIL